MGERLRYRLQRKESYVLPNILGGHSFPVYTYRWKDIFLCNDLEYTRKYALSIDHKEREKYRIIDTENGDKEESIE